MIAANQVNLRERVEDRARRFAHELQRTPNVERSVQRLFRSLQVAKPHGNLTERGERYPEAVRRARLLLQLDAAFGERERLVVPMLHHRDVCLIAAHGRHHVPCLDHEREPLRMAERPHRFVEPPLLRQRHSRKRVDQRQVTKVPRGMERGCGLRDVLPHDGAVANLAIAEAKLVMGEADGSRVVGALSLFQGAGKKRYAA